MFTDEDRERALKVLAANGGRVTKTLRELGYPSRQTPYRWIEDDRSAARRANGRPFSHYSHETRKEAMALLQRGWAPREIAESLGLANPAVVYNWARSKKGKVVEMTADPARPEGEERAWSGFEGSEEERIAQLELENDILRGVVEVLKAESLDALTNREKTILIEHLRQETSRPLRELTGFLKISKSSYEYQRAALRRPDKYAEARGRIVKEFEAAGRTRGYRYITHILRLRERPLVLSEKVVRRIMAEEACRVIYLKKARRYSSYAGEISKAPSDLVKRDFRAALPNRLWLTDVTEFGLPCGKCYLSPILDCFDGSLVSWSIGPKPTAEFANRALLAACEKKSAGDHPILHSDRGVHYRWPGWTAICDRNGVVRSMSRKGCSPDNAAMEGFYGRLKNEFFYHRGWTGITMDEFISLLNGYLCYYNESRLKESLSWMSPNQHRRSLGLADWKHRKTSASPYHPSTLH